MFHGLAFLCENREGYRKEVCRGICRVGARLSGKEDFRCYRTERFVDSGVETTPEWKLEVLDAGRR